MSAPPRYTTEIKVDVNQAQALAELAHELMDRAPHLHLYAEDQQSLRITGRLTELEAVAGRLFREERMTDRVALSLAQLANSIRRTNHGNASHQQAIIRYRSMAILMVQAVKEHARRQNAKLTYQQVLAACMSKQVSQIGQESRGRGPEYKMIRQVQSLLNDESNSPRQFEAYEVVGMPVSILKPPPPELTELIELQAQSQEITPAGLLLMDMW